MAASFSADAQIDSLKNVLKSVISADTSVFSVSQLYESIGRAYEGQYNFDSAFSYYDRQEQFVVQNITDAISRDSIVNVIYMNRSFASMSAQKNELSLSYADSAIQIATRSNLLGQLPRGYNNKAVALNNLGRYEDAIKALLLALENKEFVTPVDTRDYLHQNVLINIGKNYLGLKNFDEAIRYLSEALEVFDKSQRNYALIYLNLSAAYLGKDDNVNAFETALKADSVASAINHLPIKINAILNQASSLEKQSKFKESLTKVDLAMELAEQINFVPGTALGLGLRGNIYAKLGRYGNAIENFKTSIKLGKTYQDFEYLATAYESISETYARSKDYDNAYRYYQLFDHLKDSIVSSEANANFSEILVKYETAEKEKKIAKQDLELQTQKATIATQRAQTIALIAGIGLLLLGGLLIYNRIRSQQKAHLQAVVLAEQEKGFTSVINATEQERNRISKDLHDGIGQQLSALKMALATVSQSMGDTQEKNKIEQITASFSRSADEVRQISHQMMPRSLMENGLVKAIEDLLYNSFHLSAIQYEFEHQVGEKRFDQKIEISLYRIVQELVNNVIKHSKASEVSVQLLQNKGNLLLFVEDNGVGTGKNTDSGGHGLMNIKSRLQMIKGSVNFEPSPESGTSVTVKIPVML
ncbi:MAG: sensor histidine kinase [Bacteroidota bacterium]